MNELEKYLIAHSTPQKEALEWIERQTHLRTKFAHMLAGFEAGRLLETFSLMLRPRRILEIGTFTGYSSVCLAAGLPEEGRLDAVEINDEYLALLMGDSPEGAAPKVRSGSWILADNVLWDGKVLGDSPKQDPQSRGIQAFNEAVAADPRLENFILTLRDGINIIKVL